MVDINSICSSAIELAVGNAKRTRRSIDSLDGEGKEEHKVNPATTRTLSVVVDTTPSGIP
jgi:hypothetical protein